MTMIVIRSWFCDCLLDASCTCPRTGRLGRSESIAFSWLLWAVPANEVQCQNVTANTRYLR